MSASTPTGTSLRERGLTPMVLAGYGFALLGGWVGIILALVIRNRHEPEVRKHAKPVAAVALVAMILWTTLAAAM